MHLGWVRVPFVKFMQYAAVLPLSGSESGHFINRVRQLEEACHQPTTYQHLASALISRQPKLLTHVEP